jgi:hypothetical protein
MKPFRKSRDFDGRFALTTLQNPDLNVESHLSFIIAAKNRAEARVEAEMTAEMAAEIAAEQAAEAAPGPASHVPAPHEPLQRSAPRIIDIEPAPPPSDQISGPVSALPLGGQLADSISACVPRKTTSKTKEPRAPNVSATRKKKTATHARHISSFLPQRKWSPLERHRRKCIICRHPDCEAIEQDFTNWNRVDDIVKDYELGDYRIVYRHAHATGLFERRRMNMRFAAEMVVEDVYHAETTCADTILRAIRVCTRLNDRGEWVQPTSHVVFSSSGRAAAANQPDPASQPEPPISNRQPARLEKESK